MTKPTLHSHANRPTNQRTKKKHEALSHVTSDYKKIEDIDMRTLKAYYDPIPIVIGEMNPTPVSSIPQ